MGRPLTTHFNVFYRSFDILFNYYVSELRRGTRLHHEGAFRVKDIFRPFFNDMTSKRSFTSKTLAPSEICDYVRKYYPPPKIVATQSEASKTLPHLAVEDDFVLPVRRDNPEDAANDPVVGVDDQDANDGDDDDIQKMLEKVFAENDRRKAETELQPGPLLESFRFPELKAPKVDDEQIISYSVPTVDPAILAAPVPTIPLRQTKINGGRKEEFIQTGNGVAKMDFRPISSTTTPGILSTEPESNFDYEEILTEVPNDKKYRHRVSPEKSKHPDVKDPALEDANLNRKSPEDDVTIEELPAFSNSPSQVVSEFSDSGHEELIFSTDNTPLDPQAPSRDQCTKTFLQ